MGKGGTRFVGDAIGSRANHRKLPTGKDMRKDMEKFLETGQHPEIEEAKNSQVLFPLPQRDASRPHVFLEFKAGSKVLGRIVVELFESDISVAAAEFRKRCSPGATGGFQGTTIHKLLHNMAAFGGKSNKYKSGGLQLRTNDRIQHVEGGVVSISRTGEEFALVFRRALHLDATHQVVGRVFKGSEVFDVINDFPTNVEDTPRPPIIVSACGHTDSKGNHDALGGAGTSSKAETAEETAAKLQQESAAARDSVREALTTGLTQKRHAEHSSKDGPAKKKSALQHVMIEGLDDMSSDDDSDDAAG